MAHLDEKFGDQMKNKFMLSEKCIFLNHGSYGAVARSVHEEKLRMQRRLEEEPDDWFRRSYQQEYLTSVDRVAQFVGANCESVALIQNATAGINAVLKSIPFTEEDSILINSWTYGAVKNAVEWTSKHTGAKVLTVDMRVPVKDKSHVIDAYRHVIRQHKNIKLAIIDIIVSVPPVFLPFKELCSLCQDNGIWVLLDGAHTPGQIRVELDKWNADFYVGNLHKWVYSSRGCAVLYVRRDHRLHIDPPVISSYQHEPDLRTRFFYQGTDDGSALCVAKDAIEFYEGLGGLEAIGCYNNNLVTKAATTLADRWRTTLLTIPADMEAPYMRMVRLPNLKQFPAVQEIPGDVQTLFGDMKELTYTLMDRFRIVALCLYLQGEPYVRLSANVYNSMADYQRLADAILQLELEGNR